MRPAVLKQLAGALLLLGMAANSRSSEAQTPGDAPAEHPPLGPADVMKAAGAEGHALERNGPLAAEPPIDTDKPTNHEATQTPLQPSQVASQAQPSADVAADSVRVEVVDPEGAPVANAVVMLGVLGQGGGREKLRSTTDERGVAEFRKLQTGTAQAYRASLIYGGATYAAPPFRLSGEQGVMVRLVRRPTTREAKSVIQSLGQALIEFKDGRLHVSQQMRLANLGKETYVFPKSGLRVQMPKGFTAFAAQQTMGDQRITPNETGVIVEGSVPPGEAVLTWAFDLPIHGSSTEFALPVPFRTFRIRVMSQAPPGLEMQVQGLPEAQQVDDSGSAVLMTQLQRKPSDAPLRELRVTLKGVPGPGPLRWFTVAIAALLVLAGVTATARLRQDSSATRNEAKRAREAKREELLAQVRELDQQLTEGVIGDSYYKKTLSDIVTEVAATLREDHQSAQGDVLTQRPV